VEKHRKIVSAYRPEVYTSGEVLWFKIYYVDGAFHKPGGLSKIAYVEIISEK
jgi:hypothetical protein